MAALLRHGARRIGQRAQAAFTAPAVAEERRLLVPRRMLSTGERGRPSELEVQQKKDELYEALSKVENWRNRRLLQDLAVHVYPRPQTIQWRRLRASKWATNVADDDGALLRQAARRIGSSVLQQTQAAVAQERRRLVPRRLYSTEKGAGEDAMDKWNDRCMRFRRFDSQFTKALNFGAGVYCIYAILAAGNSPPWPIRRYRLKCEEGLD